MKTRIYSLVLIIILSFGFTAEETMAQETSLVQVKTFDQSLKIVPHLELSFDNQNYFTTGRDGTVIIEIPNTLLPPKAIYITDTIYEAETWNYSRGVLEIVIRVKTFEIYNLTVLDTGGVLQKNLLVRLESKEPKEAITNDEGIVQFPVPLDLDLTKPQLIKINGYSITSVQTSGNSGIIVIKPIPVLFTEPDPGENIVVISSISLASLDSVNTLTEFYEFIRVLDMTALDEEQKQMVDNKFRALMIIFSDSISQSSSLIGLISDSSLVKDDILYLTEQALKESRAIRDIRLAFNKKVSLINDKLLEGGGNLSDEERQRLLIDLNNLEALLKENEILYEQTQADFKSTLNQLKNKLLNIQDLEEQLSASELQRLTEQKEFRKRLFAVIGIGLGLLLLITLLIYLAQKFNKQRRALAGANAEVKRINDNLENLVAIKTESLRKVNKELDTFIYRSSHDLRRPITSIIGLANVAKLTMDGESYSLFELTKKTALGMDRLLHKLLMVNHINFPADYAEVNFRELIDEISSEFKDILEENKINFSYDIAKDLQYSSYPKLVEIVITTILENALFYSTFCRVGKPKVKITVNRKDSNLYINIHDNGEGIPEEVTGKVWNMFFIGNEKSNGNGLGLYIAKKAVEILSGEITFTSSPGESTKFIIKLPYENKKIKSKSVINPSDKLKVETT